MLNSTNNISRGNAVMSSDTPPLRQCLHLDPITLENQKYTGELRRAFGVPSGNALEDHSSGVLHPKPSPPVVREELKHFKESVKDASKKARDRAKLLHESISKLDRYRESLNTKKRQRSDMSLNERSNVTNVAKMGSQMHRNSPEIMAQRPEDRPKSAGLNKRFRANGADVRADARSAAVSRQQTIMEKGGDTSPDVGGGTARFEEKIRKLPAGGEGWETKNKKKRSVGVVGGRVLNGEREIKRVIHSKMNAESKLRCSDAPVFRSKTSPGVSGVNKLDSSAEPASSDTSSVLRNEIETETLPRDRMSLMEQRAVIKGNNKSSNIYEENLASSPSTVIKAKGSRGPRTGSIMLLDSSLKVQSSSASLQGLEQPTSSNSNKVQLSGGGNNYKRQMSAGSASHPMQWVGQRPHKNSRTRRANIVSPVPNPVEPLNSSQGFPLSDFSARASSIGTNGSLAASSIDNNIPKMKREVENVLSPFEFSESEESGSVENRFKGKGMENREACLPASKKSGAFLLPTRKNKLLASEIGDGVRRQGRTGRGSFAKPAIHPIKEKLENVSMTKQLQNAKPASDKNKSKTGRPPSKKLKDRKGVARIGPTLSSGSLDFTGESDDDREELFAAANSARNASSHACSSKFWKQMESIFASVSTDDISYLKQQMSFAEELNEGLSQMLGIDYDVLGVLVHNSVEREGDENGRKFIKTNSFGRGDVGKLDKGTPLYQRVLSALIEEDESEEIYIHGEGKNIPPHYASDDSHCGSCNLIDIEPKDRDRMESEVESKVNFQSQKSSFLDMRSCDKSVASNTLRNSSMCSSLHSNGQWQGDDLLHSEVGNGSEICSSDRSQLQMRDLGMNGFCSSERQYQYMCLEEKLMLELQSIGLCPETLPDLAEEDDVINQNIEKLKQGLSQQIDKKRKKLGKIDKAIQKDIEVEKRNMEQVAMDQLIEIAYRKRLPCRGNGNSKSVVRKVSRQAALAFARRTLERCKNFEETGSSCFSEPALKEVLFSAPLHSNDAKSVDCVGSGTASSTCIEVSNNHAEARGSGAVSSSLERCNSHIDYFDEGKKREALIDDVIGSASSRVTSTLDSTVIVGQKGKRSDRDGSKNERKMKSKPRQKSAHLTSSGNGPRGSIHGVANASNKFETDPLSLNNISVACIDAEEPLDFSKLEFDPVGVEMSTDLGGNQDLDSWFNLDDETLQGHDSMGLEIPMDDLSDLMLM